MKSFSYALLASALTSVTAQSSSDDEDIRVWAAVAFINHGDKTPSLGQGDEVLVPEGAQQLWRQGAAFRARYLQQASGDTSNSTVDAAPIDRISHETLNPVQLNIASTDDQWVVAGAMSFMQGLYPPVTGSVSTDMMRNLASDDEEFVDYPLDGYQYPTIHTLSSYDKYSPGIQGTVGCTEWFNQTSTVLREREDMKTYQEDSLDLYENLLSSDALAGSIRSSDGNFWNAYEIYEYVRYMYTHNETVFEGLENANETLAELEKLALNLERAKLTKASTWTGSGDEDTAEVMTVAGRALARRIVDQLRSNISLNGARDKLSVMFGSFEPLLSFLSVAGILTRENLASGPFSRFPEQGAALVLELISDGRSTDTQPGTEDLSVRFLYRENANEGTSFEGFSLFGSGMSGQSIPYTSFAREMTDEGLSSDAWCNVCKAEQASWCPDAEKEKDDDEADSDGSGMYGPDSGRMNPAVAGVIGAAIFGATVGLAIAALYLFAGFRLRRVGPEERSSVMGGFKGPEKKDGDADVEVTGGGAQQARIGSWELGGGDGSASVVSKEPTQAGSREVNHWREDDEISLVGQTPVTARESL